MSISKTKKEEIKEFILSEINKENSPYIETIKKYNITRQTIRNYLKDLEKNNLIEDIGKVKKEYILKNYIEDKQIFKNLQECDETKIYNNNIKTKYFENKKNNFVNIFGYAFTEMVNNAIEHSNGKELIIEYIEDYFNVYVKIKDDGIGIFNKIMKDHNILDEDTAIFELSKGKLTSDKDNHSGEGIFFTSKIVNNFFIISGKKMFMTNNGNIENNNKTQNSIVEKDVKGTAVIFSINKNTNINSKKIFDKYAENSLFNTTQIILKLSDNNCNSLISRSEAKRILFRTIEFEKVILDFEEIQFVGQGFCDEVFRVFKLKNPNIKLEYINAEEDVKYMIDRAIASYHHFIKIKQ